MTGFASKLIGALFGKASLRPTAGRRQHASLRFEPLEPRAVLSTVMPTATVDDLIVNAVISGETVEVGRGGGMGAGKVSMQDFSFHPSASATSRHTGGVNVVLADGSVRFISDTIALRAAEAAGSGGTIIYTGLEQASSHGSGGGAGKVAMQDFPSTAAPRRHSNGANFLFGDGAVRFISDTLIDRTTGTAGAGAPGGHVKVFDGTRSAELGSFFAFGGFNGGVVVAASDVDGDKFTDIITGAGPGAGPHVKVFDGRDTGIDYDHLDLYKNIWINQSLESIIDDLASDASRHDAAR